MRSLLILPIVLLSACGTTPDFEVLATRDLGPLETHDSVRARDGGYSGRFQDHSVWLCGDSILAWEGEDGSSWRHNSWSWTEDLNASDGVTGFDEPRDALEAPIEFFPMTEVEAEYNRAHADGVCEEEPCPARRVLWPGPLVDAGERGLAFYTKIHGEPGEWNFEGLGCGVATWEDWDDGPIRHEVRPGTDEPTLLWTAEQGFCVSGALVEHGWLWAWSCGGNPGKPCHLGRVAPGEVLDPDAWSYFAGEDRWSADVSDAASLFSGMDMTSVHRNEHLDRLVAIYSESFSEVVSMRTAERPEGPWTAPVTAFEAEAPAGDGNAYCGLGHAELMGDGGRLEYVSYYRGTGDWEGEVRLVEVEVEAR